MMMIILLLLLYLNVLMVLNCWAVVQNLNTKEPLMELQDGTVLVGEFEETLGSNIIFSGA